MSSLAHLEQVSIPTDDVANAARILREAVRNKSYRAFPLGQRAGEYLRWKRGRLTEASYKAYESCLDKLARWAPDLDAPDFEPPVGRERLEEFMDAHWGGAAPRTYNKNLSIVSDFFKFLVLRGSLHGDPTLGLEPHKKRDVHREIFRDDDRRRILADGPSSNHLRRDRIALRLLLQYGIRKGALRQIQFRHLDASRYRLTIFTKGAKVRELPIPDPAFWDDVEKLQFEWESEPHHFLMPREKTMWRGYIEGSKDSRFEVRRYPDIACSGQAIHDWWYRCLERAGLVTKGTRSGEKMHKARHTAGQVVLDKTGNLKAAQKLLGHASIQTTADIYTDWDIDQLTETMRQVIGE